VLLLSEPLPVLPLELQLVLPLQPVQYLLPFLLLSHHIHFHLQ
jgi:hypothetical protein